MCATRENPPGSLACVSRELHHLSFFRMFALMPLRFMGYETRRCQEVIARLAETVDANGVSEKYSPFANIQRAKKLCIYDAPRRPHTDYRKRIKMQREMTFPITAPHQYGRDLQMFTASMGFTDLPVYKENGRIGWCVRVRFFYT